MRNEIEHLPRLLEALARQREAPSFALCLFFDNCTDGSIDFVQRRAPTLPYSIASDYCDAGGPANAGAARRRAMALALHHAPDGILLTTDADSEPAPDWLAANISALAHADVIAGKITRDGGTPDALIRLDRYLDRLHQLRRAIDPVPWEAPETHHCTSGASIALRAEVYRQLGGFQAVRNGEDGTFVEAASCAGYRVRRDARVQVKTSSRRTGRAPDGFAAALAECDTTTPETWHPEDMAWRFQKHAAARAAYREGAPDALAAALGMSRDQVCQIAAESSNDEAFASRIVGARRGGVRSIALDEAEMLMLELKPQSDRGPLL